MAQLFDVSTDNIGLHLRKVYEDGELAREATAEESSVVQGQPWTPTFSVAVRRRHLSSCAASCSDTRLFSQERMHGRQVVVLEITPHWLARQRPEPGGVLPPA